jgi:hypothetical protein
MFGGSRGEKDKGKGGGLLRRFEKQQHHICI